MVKLECLKCKQHCVSIFFLQKLLLRSIYTTHVSFFFFFFAPYSVFANKSDTFCPGLDQGFLVCFY